MAFGGPNRRMEGGGESWREDPGWIERGEEFGIFSSRGGFARFGGFGGGGLTLGGLDTLRQLACNNNTETAGQAQGARQNHHRSGPFYYYVLRRVGQDSKPLQSHFCLCLHFYIGQ